MTATKKTETKPYNVKTRAGRGINATEKAVLRLVEDKLHKLGYSCLGSLFARAPGLLKFFATTYRNEGAPETLPPFGVTVVNFLNNGQVTVTVVNFLNNVGEGETPKLDVQWK